jgi:hypothetical protein
MEVNESLDALEQIYARRARPNELLSIADSATQHGFSDSKEFISISPHPG